ncbi:hypothetical protein DQ04_04711010 [Trypanosoma grayi]|uniref:hypothetical protein n=1 Tax=Trypanosoma grayi TaxID=71804 RepID=UPI0004F482EC|nr:hypothetical protein DQ04_04711010 [Trypanosoma grayi]KEG09748.1 hypothetical protein DQ04_04711010 [Trypanosoma grayi]
MAGINGSRGTMEYSRRRAWPSSRRSPPPALSPITTTVVGPSVATQSHQRSHAWQSHSQRRKQRRNGVPQQRSPTPNPVVLAQRIAYAQRSCATRCAVGVHPGGIRSPPPRHTPQQ